MSALEVCLLLEGDHAGPGRKLGHEAGVGGAGVCEPPKNGGSVEQGHRRHVLTQKTSLGLTDEKIWYNFVPHNSFLKMISPPPPPNRLGTSDVNNPFLNTSKAVCTPGA